jgi:hypothetical protein
MTIRYTCGSCGSVLKIKDELAGTPGKCPKCKHEFTVPAAPAAADQPDAAAAPAGKEGHAAAAAPADEEFDPVAFLMADGGGRAAAAAPTVPPPPAPAPKRSAANEPPQRRPIRMDDEAPAAPRRGAGESPTAAETADAMLRTNASSNAKELLTRTMEESRVRAAQMPDEDQGKPGIDFKELWRELGFKIAPLVAGLVVLVVLTFWFGRYMVGGGRDLPDLARVSGVVTKGGSPLAGAEVVFTPMDVIKKSSYGFTDEQGEYSLIYDEDANGAVVGKCRVEVTRLDERGRNIVEGKYSATDPGLFVVESGSNECNIEIP